MPSKPDNNDYLEFPPSASSYPSVYALGRMTAAWGRVEHGFFALLTTLFATINDPVQDPDSGKSGRNLDYHAAAALYFSQDSSRGRRQMVINLARSRKEEKKICKELYTAIVEVCDQTQTASKNRNAYSHQELRFMKDGKIEIQAPDTIIDPRKKRRHPPSEIDKATEEIMAVVKRLFKLTISCLDSPLKPPPPPT